MSVLLKQNFRLFVCVLGAFAVSTHVYHVCLVPAEFKRVSDDQELPLHVAVNYQVGARNQTPFSVTARAFNHCASPPVPKYQLS